MKKTTLFGSLLIFMLAILFLAMPSLIKNRDTGNRQAVANATNVKKVDKKIKVGLLQFMDHPSLNEIRQGFYDQMAQRGYVDGQNLTIDFANGQGDQSNLKMLSEKMMANKDDYLVGIATPAAQALKNVANDQLPVVMSAISDPIAAGLVDSLEKPGKNVTGVSGDCPIEKQFDIIHQVMPELKTLGIIYNSSETNAFKTVQDAKKIAESMGIKVVEKTITSTNDLGQVAEQLSKEVEALFVPNDNTIASSMNTLISVTNSHKIPVFPVADAMVKAGGVATVGITQYQFGVDTANVLADLIEGKDAREYPVVFTKETAPYINSKEAKLLGIQLPEELVKKAKDMGKEG
ncbi:tryptophan ABC transporter substrate-binding protein [Aerococcus christensenii]|uniref:tryptophan ABC transporter substrate-binding protein n=1 Tax=Aerococcus christensenii TaxID=87541 RepID=UPI000763165E|nr:tryptophan ABC transporter substrate-binding protein [Aerococcus christensenii]AMB92045.1 ABC transporter substrate-binding protein [Aerococcus christensenii]